MDGVVLDWFMGCRVRELVGLACAENGVQVDEVLRWVIRSHSVALEVSGGRIVFDYMDDEALLSASERPVLAGLPGEGWLLDGCVFDVLVRACECFRVDLCDVDEWIVYPQYVKLILSDRRLFTCWFDFGVGSVWKDGVFVYWVEFGKVKELLEYVSVRELVGVACVDSGERPERLRSWCVRPDVVELEFAEVDIVWDGIDVDDGVRLCDVDVEVLAAVPGAGWILVRGVSDVVRRACECLGVDVLCVDSWEVFPFCVRLMLDDGRVLSFCEDSKVGSGRGYGE